LAKVGDMVTVRKTKMIGKVVAKSEVFDDVTYRVEQLNGKDVIVKQSEIQE
jgi:hypothetical protein